VWILSFLVDLLFWEICYAVGRKVVVFASFGKVQPGPVDSCGHNWIGCKRDGAGRLEIESTLVGGVGLITFCAVLALILFFIR
jgi:hypothetical protein